MQKREGFRVKFSKQMPSDVYMPKPRECGTLTAISSDQAILIGGKSSCAVDELSLATVDSSCEVQWEKITLRMQPKLVIRPRQ
jgi:hypothetical protein